MEPALSSLVKQNIALRMAKTILLLGLDVLLSPQAWAQHPIVTFSQGAPGDPFNGPQFVAFGAAGNLFLSDTKNHRVQRIDKQTGTVSTVVGTGTQAAPATEVPGSIRFPSGSTGWAS